MIKVGSDFSGIGAFKQALLRLGIPHKQVFACDWDAHARKSYSANYGEPDYYPHDVNDRTIPQNPLDVYMTSPPCQAFSMAGKRGGEDDERGILFYNSHQFIATNQPRFFIFENVKGLLSHDKPYKEAQYGRTFNKWIQYLGGKSINGNLNMVPHPKAVPYHMYYKVLNATDFNVPQNRERVFIVGIRDDADNVFDWPTPVPLEKRLIDVLEDEVDEKYFLSEKMLQNIMGWNSHENPLDVIYDTETPVMGCLTASGQADLHAGLKLVNHAEMLHGTDVVRTIRSGGRDSLAKKHNHNIIKIGYINQDTQASQVFDSVGDTPTLSAGTHGYAQGYVKVKSATKEGYEVAGEGDSINFSNPSSETRRGRVGKKVAQTLDTSCNQGVCIPVLTPDRPTKQQNGRRFKDSGDPSFTLTAQDRHGVLVKNPQRCEYTNGNSQGGRVYDKVGVSPTLVTCGTKNGLIEAKFSIRRLTPRECLRLMDFPDGFKLVVSDTQAYKQSGNSIVVAVLAALIKQLKL